MENGEKIKSENILRLRTGSFKNCKICGKRKYFQKAQINRNKHFYCSSECYFKARPIFYRGKNSGNFKGGDRQLKCSFCKKVFNRKRNACINKKNYCSKKCRKLGQSKYRSGIYAGNWQSGKIKTNCFTCKKEIYVAKHKIKNNVRCFCSNKCRYFLNLSQFKTNYNNVIFRSSWEANFAKWCDLSGIKWEYEPKTFYLKFLDKYYIPDFYLSEFDTYIEIKGRLLEKAKQKIEVFEDEYSTVNFKVYYEKDLINYSII